MSYDPGPVFDALHSKLAAAGFRDTLIGEPTDPPAQPTAIVMFAGCQLTEHALAVSSGILRFNIRFYYDALSDPRGDMEKEIARMCLQIMSDLAGDFDLGGASVRNIQPGQEGRMGYQTIGEGPKKWYRVNDLTVEVMVNDLVTWTA